VTNAVAGLLVLVVFGAEELAGFAEALLDGGGVEPLLTVRK
jgi:hypothetical protein